MRLRLLFFGLLVLVLAAACGSPTVVYVVVTATPETTVEATALAALPSDTAVVTPEVQPTATSTETLTATVQVDATSVPTSSGPTPLPEGFPTPFITQLHVAEQLFEHGRMYWVERTSQIWVLHITGEGRGDWYAYEDTFQEGEPEIDPNLTPPDGRLQPERGFGKLWREIPGLRDMLGWAVQPEAGYISRYEYHLTDQVDAEGRQVGYHVLYSLGGEQFRFNEINSTWQLGGA